MARGGRWAWVAAAVAAGTAAAAAPAGAADRYALVNGCYDVRPATADTAALPDAGPFRMQATDLGRYLLFGREGRMPALAGDGRTLTTTTDPGPSADVTVEDAGPDVFALRIGDRQLGRFAFAPAEGCATFPEAEVNATGTPSKGATPVGEVKGLLDPHLHGMAFEFLGGRARCARPWHAYGVTKALVDCPDHEPGGAGALLENVQSYGTPARPHDTTGWPTFRDWPAAQSLTHEQMYYKWLERAWRGGLRLMVNLLVDNAVLCEVYPYKKNSCNEMDGVRLQLVRIRELQDYIDAQSGGPGKGWFRIVTDPFEARRTINAGKLAVVLGIEVSKLFDCGVFNGVAECGRAQIDRQLDFFFRNGVRQMELVNKFDNALAGVAGDGGTTGPIVNNANKYETGRYWDMRTCDGHAHDKEQPTVPAGPGQDVLVGGILQLFLPQGAAPVYSSPPHCNALGLSSLGEHTVREMIERGMVVDPDHMSVRAREQTLAILEAERHSGVISSHSWSTPDTFPRIYRLGGVVTPIARQRDFVDTWRRTRAGRDPRFLFGFGFGSDVNGFATQPPARPGVRYPFKSLDGAVTLDRVRAGQRTWDFGTDGVAHYGLYPDWLEELRLRGGPELVEDMLNGAEAYLQMWERATGVPAERCKPARRRFTSRGLGRVGLGLTAEALLRRAGQPSDRPGRTWTWCVQQREDRRGRIRAVLAGRERSALVVSTYPEHEAAGVGPGDRASAARRVGRRIAPGLYVRGGARRFVFRVRRGRVTAVGVTTARSPASVRRLLREARVR